MTPHAFACFTFDNMGEAADVGAGLRDGPRADGTDPSLAVGYPRLYALLAAAGVRATFFVEGWNGVHHPDAVADVVRHGHELGMHGWAHEPWRQLTPHDEDERAARATEALARAAGVRPVGFRAPGGARTAHTETALRRLGYRYDASLGDAMRPQLLPSGLAQIPFVWPAVDGFHYLRPEPADPSAVRATWLGALQQVASRGGLFLVICHAFITGVDEARCAVLADVLRAAVADARITIHTAGEIADALLAGAAADHPSHPSTH
ncbi:MAG: polysaccharide deacetylase family protein [Deltaproteobacteria bacterium]|nr:polysaccharide deacetylase family protein [Deltaproteobacteria bacterium]